MGGNERLLQLKKWKMQEWAGIFLFALGLYFAVQAVFSCFSADIWYDELFTMGLIDQPLTQLVSLTARDVHPPFYYLYVKGVFDLCKLANPLASPVVVGKLCSVLPFFLLFGYGAVVVRKHFGLFSAGLFSFCVVTMPQLPQFTTEIRMYSLALFLVTAAYLHAYGIRCSVQEGEEARGKRRDWICLCSYGILAAYTHYFAAVAAAMIYLYIMIALFKNRRKKALCVRWGLSVFISVLSYMPWLVVVSGQVEQVKENYWILPLTIRSLGGCVKFLLKPAFSSEVWNVILAVALFLLYIGIAFFCVFGEKEKKKENGFILGGIGVLAGVVVFGFAASFLIRPVFIYRYMLPAAGIFWLCFAVGFGRVQRRFGQVLMIPVLLVLVVTGIRDFRAFYGEEAWKKGQMALTQRGLEQIDGEDVVIFNFDQVQATLGYYLDNETYLWEAEPEILIREMFKNRSSVQSAEEIITWIKNGQRVWFVGSGNAREDLLKSWKESGILALEKGSFLLERYWFNLYEISLSAGQVF